MTDALRKAHERLETAVTQIVSGDDWRRTLKVASSFHRYSFNNHLLIFSQRPDATLVAGFRKWLQLGRHVRKGEKGIAILAPCKYKTKIEDDDGEEQTLQQIRGFRVVYVFDISQTDGEPLRTPMRSARGSWTATLPRAFGMLSWRSRMPTATTSFAIDAAARTATVTSRRKSWPSGRCHPRSGRQDAGSRARSRHPPRRRGRLGPGRRGGRGGVGGLRGL